MIIFLNKVTLPVEFYLHSCEITTFWGIALSLQTVPVVCKEMQPHVFATKFHLFAVTNLYYALNMGAVYIITVINLLMSSTENSELLLSLTSCLCTCYECF